MTAGSDHGATRADAEYDQSDPGVVASSGVRAQDLAARLSRIIAATTPSTLGVAVDECLEQVGRTADADAAFMVLVDDREHVTDVWTWLRPGVSVAPPQLGEPLRQGFGSAVELLRIGHTVVVRDVEALDLAPSERDFAAANDTRAILVAPVRIGSDLLGIAGLLTVGRPHTWPKVVIAQVELAAQLFVQAVRRTRERGALAAANARARRIAEFIPDGLLLLEPGGTVTWASPSLVRATGIPAARLVGGDLADLVHPDDRSAVTLAMDATPHGGSGLVVRTRGAQDWRWTDLSWQLVHEADASIPDEVVVSLRDVHDKHLETQELTRENRHDRLTGLLNRTGLEVALAALAAGGAAVLVAYMDIDDFKTVNDQHGHDVGDEVLRCSATALRGAVRSTDLAARVGGDELVVVVRVEDPLADGDPTVLGARLVGALRRSLAEGFGDVTASVGLAGPGPASEAWELVRRADKAMYQAKRSGGDRFATSAS